MSKLLTLLTLFIASVAFSADGDLVPIQQKSCTEDLLENSVDPERPSSPKNIFEELAMAPREGQDIVIISDDRHFIGDSILQVLLKMSAIHNLFPHSKIRLVHSFASLFRATDWFTPVTVPSSISNAHQFFEFLTTTIRHTDFVVDLSYVQTSLFMYYMESRGIPLMQIGALRGGIANQHKPAQGYQTRYEQADIETQILFGATLRADPIKELMVDSTVSKENSRNILQQIFPRSTNYDFLIFNFNTAGAYKVQYLVSTLLQRLEQWVATAVIENPDIKILIPRPEPPIALELRQEIEKYVQAHSQNVGFFPQDRSQWPDLIDSSRAVLSQDSGFVHVALWIKSPQEVFTFGPSQASGPQGGPRYWRRADQPFAELPPNPYRIEDDQAILEYIRKHARVRVFAADSP